VVRFVVLALDPYWRAAGEMVSCLAERMAWSGLPITKGGAEDRVVLCDGLQVAAWASRRTKNAAQSAAKDNLSGSPG
jgi:hypothetical protein